MNPKAMYNLSYGLFLIGTRFEDQQNGCIVNTVFQVAGDPTRITLACINGNDTPELIRKSGTFAVTVLDETAPFELFRTFGMQHGRDVNKFAAYKPRYDENGMPYLTDHACSVLSAKVVSEQDLGSHTLFIAEVIDGDVLSANPPATYSYYQSHIKPKPQTAATERKIVGWRCRICGYVYENPTLPADFACPLCGHPADDFEPIYG